MAHRRLSAFLISLALVQTASAGPQYTTIKRSLEAAPVENAKVLYWDQNLADDLGIVTAQGRVGQKAFEKSVTDQIALLIKKSPGIVDGSQSARSGAIFGAKRGAPRYVEVELDAHGGSGRAGYIKLVGRNGKDLWVNIKGIGLTGVGNAKSRPAGPPLEVYGDHSDGSADLPEGIVETINAQIAFNDLKYGAGRILSLITIDKNINLENNVKYPLILIVRAPMRRMDRELSGLNNTTPTLVRIADSLGQANAMRIFKGDFVNQSNIGAGGEFVDFGLFSVVNGYVPAYNYLKVTTLKETDYLFKKNAPMKNAYQSAIGKQLIRQLGIDETRLKVVQFRGDPVKTGLSPFITLAQRFIKLVYAENSPIDAENSGVEKARELRGNFRAHELFREMAPTIVMWNGSRRDLIKRLYEMALELNEKPSRTFEWGFKDFAASVVDIVQAATADVRGDVSYAAKLKLIASFKNRDVPFLDKRTLREWSVDVMNKYVQAQDPTVVQKAIDEVVNHSKLGTGDFSTSQLRVTADGAATYLDLKAAIDGSGRHGLFAYPELPSLRAGTSRKFRVSLDGRRNYSSVDAELVQTQRGLYYRLTIPHGSFQVTKELTSIIPVSAENSGSSAIEITAPPLLLNERLGLARDFSRVPSLMRTRYGVKIDPVAADDKVIARPSAPVRPLTCSAVFGSI